MPQKPQREQHKLAPHKYLRPGAPHEPSVEMAKIHDTVAVPATDAVDVAERTALPVAERVADEVCATVRVNEDVVDDRLVDTPVFDEVEVNEQAP